MSTAVVASSSPTPPGTNDATSSATSATSSNGEKSMDDSSCAMNGDSSNHVSTDDADKMSISGDETKSCRIQRDEGENGDSSATEGTTSTMQALHLQNGAAGTRGHNQPSQEPKPFRSPLPPDLLRILTEVAQTGSSSSLTWSDTIEEERTGSNAALEQSSGNKRPRIAGTHSPGRHVQGIQHPTPVRPGEAGLKLAENDKKPTATRNSVPKPTNGLHRHHVAAAPSGKKRSHGAMLNSITGQSADKASSSVAAATSSELSPEQQGGQGMEPASTPRNYDSCLKEAFRAAMQMVLDHFYKNRGGYKLSPAEKKRIALKVATRTKADADNSYEAAEEEKKGTEPSNSEEDMEKHYAISEEKIFLQRRRRLLNLLEPGENADDRKSPPLEAASAKKVSLTQLADNDYVNNHAHSGPPFTIQRIAEVLVAPERYYTQTHKLCNCLEKLLLVTSTTSAFGGSTGGDSSQSRREETELAALADEKGRLQSELYHQRRHRRNSSASSSSVSMEDAVTKAVGTKGEEGGLSPKDASPQKQEAVSRHGADDGEEEAPERTDADAGAASREALEAAARASLRTKFDHVGIDPHSSSVINSREASSIIDSRGMTNSPPPPSLTIAAPLLGGNNGMMRHPSSPKSPTSPDRRARSPLLFNRSPTRSDSPGSPPTAAHMHAYPQMHVLQLHHAVAMAGVSPMELMGAAQSSTEGRSGSASPTAGGAVAGLKSTSDMDVDSRSSASSSESDLSSRTDDSGGSDSSDHAE